VNELVVDHVQLRDLARDFWRDAGDLNADASVSGPWRGDVITPYHRASDNR
jgi:hypothetical protein